MFLYHLRLSFIKRGSLEVKMDNDITDVVETIGYKTLERPDGKAIPIDVLKNEKCMYHYLNSRGDMETFFGKLAKVELTKKRHDGLSITQSSVYVTLKNISREMKLPGAGYHPTEHVHLLTVRNIE